MFARTRHDQLIWVEPQAVDSLADMAGGTVVTLRSGGTVYLRDEIERVQEALAETRDWLDQMGEMNRRCDALWGTEDDDDE